VSSDHYETLGVSPSAEGAAIRAAYRKLMRHHHPDSNPDPEAHERAQAISVAYSVLRDPAKRAKYDEERREADVWRSVELPPRPARPPAARTAGLAAAGLAVLMVVAALAWPLREQPVERTRATATVKPQPKADPAPSRPLGDLEPENDRLASLSGTADFPPPSVAPSPAPIEALRAEPPPDTVFRVRETSTPPLPRPAKPARRQIVEARNLPVPTVPAPRAWAQTSKPAPNALAEAPKPVAIGPASTAASADRVASLQRISSGFYSQSLQHADAAKKQLLLSVRVRQTYQRAACRSDSCVADSYLRQIREVSAIMENRTSPPE
jgi:hypothetical protein